MSRPDWIDYFFNFAKVASLRSDCLRKQVGAVIVLNHRITGTGYNNTPAGVKSCIVCYRQQNKIKSGTMYETCRSIHAEMNAIIQAGINQCRGADMYIYGHSHVCVMCQRAILNAGIKRVYVSEDKFPKLPLNPEEWKAAL